MPHFHSDPTAEHRPFGTRQRVVMQRVTLLYSIVILKLYLTQNVTFHFFPRPYLGTRLTYLTTILENFYNCAKFQKDRRGSVKNGQTSVDLT